MQKKMFKLKKYVVRKKEKKKENIKADSEETSLHQEELIY